MNLILDILLFNALHLIVATKAWENIFDAIKQLLNVILL